MQQLNENIKDINGVELPPSKKQGNLRVLHVDDDRCFLKVSKQILLLENSFEIDNATSVDEAFTKMKDQSYDVIVSDFEMPQKDGLKFLKEIREQNNQIPFILFTGKGREDVAVKALNLGADRYLNKNGSPETVYCELADAINKTVERRKSANNFVASESKYRTLVENSLQGLLILKVFPLKFVFGNAAIEKILGYSVEELMSFSSKEITELVYHEDRTAYFNCVEKCLQGEQTKSCFEFRAVRKDNSVIWLETFSTRVEYEGQPAIQGLFLDITESKKDREVLRESEQKYRELADSLPDIVFETGLSGQLEFVNKRAEEISGYSLSEIKKKG